MNKKTLVILVVFLLTGAIGAGGGFIYFSLFRNPFVAKSDIKLYIRPTTPFDSIATVVSKEGNAVQRLLFQEISQRKKLEQQIRPGHYIVRQGSTVYDLYIQLSRGLQTPVTVTFNNIRTLDQLAQRFSEQLMADSLTFARLLTDSATSTEFGFTLQQFPSMFIPNTYEVYWTIQPQKLLQRMDGEYKQFWNNNRKQKAERLGITPLQASIIASIAEEESNDQNEIGIVCGLYYNRLKRGIPLQADPTVKFAMGTFDLNRILLKHLEIDSPYNTYKHAGLPPGPIRIPEGKTIDALLNHTPHGYLYMCAHEDFSGVHNFAKTLSEHNRNASRYQAALNARKIFK